MHRSDEELVNACRNGDDSAWEAITFRYQRLLYSIARRAGLGQDLAADILQDVYTTLYLKLDKIEKPEFLRAWLVTTTKHKTIHTITRENRGRPVYLDDNEGDMAFQIEDPGILADERMVRLERAQQIESALTMIDTRCRELLIKLYLDDEKVPYSDIAEQLDIPLGSIGPTRARCLQKLLKFIAT